MYGRRNVELLIKLDPQAEVSAKQNFQRKQTGAVLPFVANIETFEDGT